MRLAGATRSRIPYSTVIGPTLAQMSVRGPIRRTLCRTQAVKAGSDRLIDQDSLYTVVGHRPKCDVGGRESGLQAERLQMYLHRKI